MRHWTGTERDTDATDPGAHHVENARFYINGEVQRRHGLVKLSASTGGLVIAPYWHPVQGQRAVFFLSTGAVVEVAAT